MYFEKRKADSEVLIDNIYDLYCRHRDKHGHCYKEQNTYMDGVLKNENREKGGKFNEKSK
jgi:hypothetical protein